MTPAPNEPEVDHETLDQHPVLNVDAQISVRQPTQRDRSPVEVGDLVAIRPAEDLCGPQGTDIWVGLVINMTTNKLNVQWLTTDPNNPCRYLLPDPPLQGEISYRAVLTVVTLDAQNCMPNATRRALIAML